MKWTKVAACTATLLVTGAAGTGCLSRPVGKEPPTTKVNFTSTISQQAVDKVDLLFAIDNSASMGDKQSILAEAVPDLIQGLLNPPCVSKADGKATGKRSNPSGSTQDNFGCDPGDEPEFKPVTDMHIGIVSSSLGGLGGDVCANTGRENDRGLLLNIKKGGGAVPGAQPGSFLAWFPQSKENDDSTRHPVPSNPVRTVPDLTRDFTDLVIGVDQTGCGLEAQLESVYRFLMQPDPWVTVRVDGAGQADLGDDIDYDVLKQRKDFLRPDSLVAVIMLTDEDDSSSDPLAIGGQGWAFMARSFPGSKVAREAQGGGSGGTTAPRGTKICDTNPGSEECTSCGFQALCADSDPACQKIKNDENCKTPGTGAQGTGTGFNGYYGPTDDDLNVRFWRMKQRFGIDPQYPLKRYIDGLTKARVPDRKSEHVINTAANGRREIANYTHTTKCTNPLYATNLPTEGTGAALCDLQRGTRSPDLVFFAVVGGVPHQLLYPEGYSTTDPEKNRVTNDKWNKILGRDPLNFDYSGIDRHMIQSVSPRPGLDSEANLPKGQNGSDPIHGRDWNTEKFDLQFACTFDLPADMQRTCDPNSRSCDCTDDGSSKNPPLCAAGARQVKAKTYPTIREFEVVRALGDQGIAASLCPIQLTDKNAPTYGYRPAVAAIIDRLKNALTTQCLPQKLRDDAPATTATTEAQPVPCLVLAQLAETTDSCSKYGLKEPSEDILKIFKEQQRAESGDISKGGIDLSALPVCEIPQTALNRGESCESETELKFCYVENDPATGKNPAGRCPQALLFSAGTAALVGARFSLQCIRQFAAGEAAGDTQQ